jgi:hypothetical protein
VKGERSNADLLWDEKHTAPAPLHPAKAHRQQQQALRAAAARSRVLPAVNSSSAETRPLRSTANESFVPPAVQQPPPRPRKIAAQLTR